MPGRSFVALLALLALACCDRIGAPAPFELHTHAGPPTLSEPIGPHPDRITVAGGDTLYGVSRKYGVPTRAIIDANNLQPPYRLVAGTSLALPQVKTHYVKGGDTLASVARLYGVDMSTLAATNHLAPPYVIRTGETLVLPSSVEAAPAPPSQAVASAAPGAVMAAPLAPLAPLPAPQPPAAMTAVATAPASPAAAPEIDERVPPLAATAPLKPPLPPSQAVAAPPPPPAVAAPSEAAPVTVPPSAPAAASSPSPSPPEQTASLPPMPAPIAGSGYLWPVRGTVLSAYGTSADGTHNDGVNIAAPEGTPVVAAAAGEVAYAGNELKGYGNLVLIKHAGGIITAYAHLSSVTVKRFDKVARGQPIGRVGATGAVSRPQLHFEIRQGARAVDPATYLPSEAASAKG